MQKVPYSVGFLQTACCEEKQMDYAKGYVYELMDRGGPTDTRESYFKEAVEEMMRARTLCARANAVMPDDPAYVGYLEELFGRKLDNKDKQELVSDFEKTIKIRDQLV